MASTCLKCARQELDADTNTTERSLNDYRNSGQTLMSLYINTWIWKHTFNIQRPVTLAMAI